MFNVDRRQILLMAAAAALTPAFGAPGRAAADAENGLALGEPRPFDFDALVEQARRLAEQPFQAREAPPSEITDRIDYEAHGKIRFDTDLAPHAGGPGIYPVTFFHIGRYFPRPVAMHLVENGQAREIRFARRYFDMPEDSPARAAEPGGFAGFRLHEDRRRDDWRTQDWAAFLGASYFRAIGALGQYGLSARGIAVDTAVDTAEEFPDFVAFYIESARRPDAPVLIHALLDGPSVTGAFRFALRRTDGVVMDIENRLFLRKAVSRLGIAPLTSMFWFAEYNRPRMVDWRPEVHDSDGLAIWSRDGERIWRPLNNPASTTVSSFLGAGPRGFGLLQRDRAYGHYLDGVNYHRRPSLWVEPLDDWGAGSIQLVEIPTDDEIHDNIGAFWVPDEPAEPGRELGFRYRLHWLADEPYPAEHLARVAATRIGRGGEPGKPRPECVDKFVVEFEGEHLGTLPDGVEPEATVTASRGEVRRVFTEPVGATGRWRAVFDLEVAEPDPVELRLYLRLNGDALSETWLYQHHPRRG